MKKSTLIFGLIQVLLDFAAVALAFIFTRDLRTHTDLIPGIQLPTGYIPPLSEFIPFAVGVALVFVGVLAISGTYSFSTRYTVQQELVRIVLLSTIWIMLVMAYFFLRRDFFFSRLVLVYGWVLATVLVMILRNGLRLLKKWLLTKGIGVTNLLFVGEMAAVQPVFARLQSNAGYHIIGIVTPAQESGDFILGSVLDLEKICHDQRVEEILHLTKGGENHVSAEEIVEFCKVHHIRYRFIPDLLELQRTNVEVWQEAGFHIIELKPTSLDGWGRVGKRLFDLIVAIVALILLSPIFLLIALWVKLDSAGPVFFRQKRVGYHGEFFALLKFRTMIKNAEQMKEQILNQSERQGPLFKIKNDPRITRSGKFLRRWSLDELPQLVNVFLGTMSLVGPRPHLPQEVEQYEKHHKMLLAIKPGMTGMAQINGRSALNFEEEVSFDLYYIQNWSLVLDLVILLKTVWVVLKKENAV